jgi:hypothetical protein
VKFWTSIPDRYFGFFRNGITVDFILVFPYFPIIVGCLVGLAILVVLRLYGSNTDKELIALERRLRIANQTMIESVETVGDRRENLRREGAPVKVHLSSPSFKKKTNYGYVVDRSTGGLRIAMTMAMAPGSSLMIKADNAPETTPWVSVIVRNCRNAGQHFELGCEFEQTPPWSVLLLFG